MIVTPLDEHRDTWTELEGDHGVALVKEDVEDLR